MCARSATGCSSGCSRENASQLARFVSCYESKFTGNPVNCKPKSPTDIECIKSIDGQNWMQKYNDCMTGQQNCYAKPQAKCIYKYNSNPDLSCKWTSNGCDSSRIQEEQKAIVAAGTKNVPAGHSFPYVTINSKSTSTSQSEPAFKKALCLAIFGTQGCPK